TSAPPTMPPPMPYSQPRADAGGAAAPRCAAWGAPARGGMVPPEGRSTPADDGDAPGPSPVSAPGRAAAGCSGAGAAVAARSSAAPGTWPGSSRAAMVLASSAESGRTGCCSSLAEDDLGGPPGLFALLRAMRLTDAG